jgi:nicotinate-nucleotide--dimethylbenzimidazole phosphoribosyltransferase
MRLGEGTGAVALLPLLDMALAVYYDLMTFADIGM